MVNFLFAVFSEHRLGQGVASVCPSAASGHRVPASGRGPEQAPRARGTNGL